MKKETNKNKILSLVIIGAFLFAMAVAFKLSMMHNSYVEEKVRSEVMDLIVYTIYTPRNIYYVRKLTVTDEIGEIDTTFSQPSKLFEWLENRTAEDILKYEADENK